MPLPVNPGSPKEVFPVSPQDSPKPFPVLVTPRLVLRSLCAEDAPALHRVWTEPAVTEYLVLTPFSSLGRRRG